MQPVVERPALASSIYTNDLLAVLQQYGYRINRVAPLDGSESFTATIKFANGLTNAANDAAAAGAGVEIGQLYRNGSVVMIRVT